MEQEDVEGIQGQESDGWLPWTNEDMIDIKQVMETKMPVKQREILEAFLMGHNAADIDVTEKYWRYHLKRAFNLIKMELGAQ